MSISYEEALATLEAMFSDPWTRETLDAVLRNQQGHMENTVDLILRHGDGQPEVLVQQLQLGIAPADVNTQRDADLARQLSGSVASSTLNTRTLRGASVTLPDDFLRIPGRSTASSGPEDQMSADARLARMLQDELFSQELARNPDFRHLAGGRRAARSSAAPRISDARTPTSPQPNVLEKISELGDNARRRLQLLAAQFNSRTNNNSGAAAAGAVTEGEARGLLDGGDTDDLELSSRKDL